MVKETGCRYKGHELAKSRNQNTKVQDEVLIRGRQGTYSRKTVGISPFQGWSLI